jgi:hypothetical protein
MKMYGGMKVRLHVFLTWAQDGGEWSVSRPDRFTRVERAPGTHSIEGWVGPRACLDVVAKRKKSHHYPCQESNPSRQARSLVFIIT